MTKPSDYQEVEIKAQSIIWCDNSLEEKEAMMNELLHSELDRVREAVIKECLEALPKNVSVWTTLGDKTNAVINIYTKKVIDQATKSIKALLPTPTSKEK